MTTPVRIEKILKDHLDELSEVDVKTFQWYLSQNVREGCGSIPLRQLENATREQTVDKLVQVYGKEGAVETTMDIFMRMNQNDLVVRLTEAISGPNAERQLHERETQTDADWTIAQDLSCSLCKSIFTDPVMLPCGHSFCRTCVHEYWKGRISQKCPLCLQVTHSEAKVNFALKSVSENYTGRGQVDPSGGHRNDSSHQAHQTCSNNIREKHEAFERVKQFCDSSIEHIKNQRRSTEQKIKDDFEKLHGLLKTEEAGRIKALEAEETQKIAMMQKIIELSGDTLSIFDTLKDMKDLGAEDSFIQNFRTEMEKAQSALPNPHLLPQALIDESSHVANLQVRVLEKILRTIKPPPAVQPLRCTAFPFLRPSKIKSHVIEVPPFTGLSTNYDENQRRLEDFHPKGSGDWPTDGPRTPPHRLSLIECLKEEAGKAK